MPCLLEELNKKNIPLNLQGGEQLRFDCSNCLFGIIVEAGEVKDVKCAEGDPVPTIVTFRQELITSYRIPSGEEKCPTGLFYPISK